MKIIEALKELPLLLKRIEKQRTLINQYASYYNKQGPEFVSEEQQRSEVAALVQSNLDLIDRYSKLRRNLNITNATIKITIEDVTKTITEWITYNNLGAALEINTLMALNRENGLKVAGMKQATLATGDELKVIACFDEKQKNDKIAKISAIKDKITATLEITNATTDLIE